MNLGHFWNVFFHLSSTLASSVDLVGQRTGAKLAVVHCGSALQTHIRFGTLCPPGAVKQSFFMTSSHLPWMWQVKLPSWRQGIDTSEVHSSLFFTPMALFADSCKWTKVAREEPSFCFTGGEGLFNRFWLLWVGGEEKEIFLWAAWCVWSLLNYPFSKFLVHFSLYVWIYVYVSTCLSINLPVHLHPCVWLGNDSHSSLPRGWIYCCCIPVIRTLAILLGNITGHLWNLVLPEVPAGFLEYTVCLECPSDPWRYPD